MRISYWSSYVCSSDLEKEGLCTFNSAKDDVAVRRVAGRLPECETEMMGAQPCNRGQLANRKIVRQMRFDIVDYPVKTGRTQAAAHGHRGRAAVGILAKQMDNRCLGQPLDKEPATGTTADQFISPSGKGERSEESRVGEGRARTCKNRRGP